MLSLLLLLGCAAKTPVPEAPVTPIADDCAAWDRPRLQKRLDRLTDSVAHEGNAAELLVNGVEAYRRRWANAEDAEKMAEKLRRNGHDVRVEEGEVKGRTWHRVRIGEFTKWDDALTAKNDFEKAEQIIAYVVPK